jgi:hypothetical protein
MTHEPPPDRNRVVPLRPLFAPISEQEWADALAQTRAQEQARSQWCSRPATEAGRQDYLSCPMRPAPHRYGLTSAHTHAQHSYDGTEACSVWRFTVSPYRCNVTA